MPPVFVHPGRAAARYHLVEKVLVQAAKRDAINDSDLVDDQPVVLQVSTTLGELRRAGLGSMPGYHPEVPSSVYDQDGYRASPETRRAR